MFEALGSWLVQLFYGWRIGTIHWLSIYGTFIAVILILAAIVLGLHSLWRILPGRWPVLILGITGLIVWGILGNPTQTIAGWLWPHSPAPWEGVDAYYYPDKSNQTVSINSRDVGSLARCRTWAKSAAAKQNDPQLERGDYHCGVGYPVSQDSLNSYRLTVR
jgi:hypothetical protein